MGELDEPSSPSDEPPQRASDVRCDVVVRSQRVSAAEADWLRDRVDAVLRVLQTTIGISGELRIELVSDAAMTIAHERWLDDPTTTDVLTFDLRDEPSQPLDTDLMLCVDEASRQAEARGIETRRELLLYAVHGLLHCTGFDDQTPEEAASMHAREDELLEAIGEAPTFLAPAGAEQGGRQETNP